MAVNHYFQGGKGIGNQAEKRLHEDLIIEGSSSQSPGVIKSISDDNFLHVVMPMFVQW